MSICSLYLFQIKDMGRDKKLRLVQNAPHFSGLKPYGIQKTDKKEVILDFEEYEAIKLCDYDMLTHEESSKLMQVSRPTFTRIYQNARIKVAKAWVEACIIVFNNGNAEVGIEWFKCNHCHLSFSILPNHPKKCPFCESEALIQNK